MNIYKFLKTAIILLFVVSFLNGCATQEKYQQKISLWKNKSINELTNALGYPDNVIKLANNQSAYIYKNNQTFEQSYARYQNSYLASNNHLTPRFYNPIIINNTRVNLRCTTWFIINNKTSKITNISFRGNNCVSN